MQPHAHYIQKEECPLNHFNFTPDGSVLEKSRRERHRQKSTVCARLQLHTQYPTNFLNEIPVHKCSHTQYIRTFFKIYSLITRDEQNGTGRFRFNLYSRYHINPCLLVYVIADSFLQHLILHT